MFCVPGLIFDSTEDVGSHLLWAIPGLIPGLVLGRYLGLGSSFHVLRSRPRLWRYHGCRVPFSCFTPPDSFWLKPRALGQVFMFGARSLFHVLRTRTHFRRYRGHQVLFSCFALPNIFPALPRAPGSFPCFVLPGPFWAVARASGPIFMFGVAGLVRGGTEDIVSHLHVLCSRNRFRRYRGRRVPFSCFALPYSFLAVPRASGPIYMFCAPGPIFDGTEGVGSRFHVLRSRARFGQYRGRRVQFSCFALEDSFSTVPRAPGSVFMFCVPGLIFNGTKDVGSRLHVLRFRTSFRRNRVRWVMFSCFALPDSFWAIARAWVQFLCFALSALFGAVPRASGPVFMFCAPGLVLGRTEGAGFRFHVL
jgi:hypothetical protein